jgi:hypothetical protein
MRKPSQSRRHKASTRTTEPRVGIFWLVDGKLLIDSTLLSKAESYGDHLTHPQGHAAVWEQYQQVGKVPPESEYEESPRGRVIYDTTTLTFTLLADKCILNRKELITKIKEELRLPKKTTLGTDSHYRCFNCLYGRDDDED